MKIRDIFKITYINSKTRIEFIVGCSGFGTCNKYFDVTGNCNLLKHVVDNDLISETILDLTTTRIFVEENLLTIFIEESFELR